MIALLRISKTIGMISRPQKKDYSSYCMKSPTVMVRSPYPSTLLETILPVWCYPNVYPYSVLMEIMRIQTELIDTPQATALKAQAVHMKPICTRNILNSPVPMQLRRRTFILVLLVPGTKASAKRKMVMMTQKTEGNSEAASTPAAPISTAQEDIHPPQVHSKPTQMNREIHSKISAVLGTSTPSITSPCFSAFSTAVSGSGSFQYATPRNKNISPMTGKAFIPSAYTTRGPSSPPTPKKPCSNSNQNQRSQAGMILKAQILISISMAEQPTDDTTIHTP